MSAADPIQVVNDIYSKAGLAKPANKATGTGSKADPGKTPAASSSPDFSISPTLSALMTQAKNMNLQGSSKADFNQSALSALNQSSIVSSMPGSGSAEANLLGQVSLYNQYATMARASSGTSGSDGSKSGADSGSKAIDNILADSQSHGTNSPTLSSQAQAMIKEGTKAAADKGLAGTDKTLAQIVGISKAIQG